jgi:hypothetical protein
MYLQANENYFIHLLEEISPKVKGLARGTI